MGANGSETVSPHFNTALDNFAYQLTSSSEQSNFQLSEGTKHQVLLRSAYHGTWSMNFPNTLAPIPRVGQCHVYDPTNNSLIVAYGVDANGNCLNDAWALYLKEMKWVKIAKELLSPREYPSATLVGRDMIIFGGHANNHFFDELHSFNLDSGAITLIQTQNCPSARTCPLLWYQNDFLYLWSGYNGLLQTELYKVSFADPTWKSFPQDTAGRAAASSCVHNGDLYVFGSSKGNGLMKFNTDTDQFESVACTGSLPSSELNHPALVSADEYIFVIGGEETYPYMYLFALDVKRKWWFAFHVRPDQQTLVLDDGIISKTGHFMMPREHSASVVYSNHDRNLICTMGSRFINPAPVFAISIGDSLGVLHLRSDMYELFWNYQ